MQGHVLARAQLVGRYSRKESGASPKQGTENAPALIDESALPSLPTALNNAMYLIGELTNDETSIRGLAEINLRFARIEEIISDVQSNRQRDGWGVSKPRSLQLSTRTWGCWIC